MKKILINIALVLVILIGFIVMTTASGLIWFCAFVPTYAAVVALIGQNTDWLKNY